jgi:hypothetical protein
MSWNIFDEMGVNFCRGLHHCGVVAWHGVACHRSSTTTPLAWCGACHDLSVCVFVCMHVFLCVRVLTCRHWRRQHCIRCC